MANGNEMALAGGLVLGQTYYWRVVPVDAGGVSLGGSTVYSFKVSNMAFSRSSIAAETVQGVTTHLETIQLESAVPQAWTATESTAWIKSVTAAGTTPATLTISIDASGLAAGLYQGSVTVMSAGSPVVVPVSLRVYAANFVIAEADLELPNIYLVSQADVSSTQPSFLLRLNTATNKIESAIPCGSGVTDLAVHYSENRIYLTNWKTGILRAYERTSLVQVQTYQFDPPGTTGSGKGDAYVVAAGKSGRIIVEEQDQWVDSWLVNTANGNKLATSYFREGGGLFDPTGRYYFHGENNSSGAVIGKFDTNGDTITSVTSKRVESYSYYGSRLVAMSGDGSRVFWNGGVFDPNLNVLMQLNEEVVSSTYRGEVIFTNTKAINGSNSQTLATLPVDTKVQAVSGDQRKLFLFKNAAVSVVDMATIANVPARGLIPGIADKTVVIGTSQELTWSQEAGALSYDVYFGNSAAAVAGATKGSPEFLGNVTGTRWIGTLPNLSLGGEYFWRVDINGFSSVTKGGTWSFGVASVDVAPRTVKLAAPAGSPVPTQSLSMTAGAATAWTASTATPWITLRATSGSTPGALQFDINTTGLTVGTRTGSIALQAAGKSFSVPVELSIVTLNVTKLVAHPTRPVVYAINTSQAGEGFSYLLEINPVTAAILRTLPIGFAPTDADLDPVGERLYVSNWGYSQTRVIDVAAWAELPSLSLGEDIYKLEITPKGRLVTEKEDQWIELNLWDAANGRNLASSSNPYFSVREGDGQADPTGNFYYHCDNNSSGATLQKYDIAADTFVRAATGPQIGYGSRNLILSGDGRRLFWLGRVLDENLNTLATMPSNAEVHATNQTGDLAIGESAVWWSDSGTQLATLPFASTVAALSANDAYLVRFNATNRTLQSIAVSSLTDLPGPKPRPGQVLKASPARFSWTPVSGATSYRIFIAADATALQAMSSPSGTVTTAEYLPASPLAFGRFYSWRVDAVTAAGVVAGKVNSFGIEFPAGPALPQSSSSSTGVAASLSDRHLLLGWNGSAQLYNFDPADGRASPIQSFTLPGYFGDHYFGASVAMDAGKASIGAYAQNSAYIFRAGSNGYWEGSGPLSPPTPVSGEGFGYGLAASGNLILAGTQGSYSTSGRVCAYVTEPGATLTQTFKASDGVNNDGFGRVIAIEGNLAVVSSPGNGASFSRLPCLYAFSRSTSTGLWTQAQKIAIPGATASDTSGRALALSGNTLATTCGSTAIILYTRNSSGQWIQSTTISRSAVPNSSTSFGSGLALASDQLFVGDPSASNTAGSGGAVFSFRRSGSSWIAGPVITPGTSTSSFSGALAVRDHWLVAVGGGGQQAWLFRISSAVNRAPRFNSAIPSQLVAGRAFNIPVLAEDPEGNSGLLIDKLQGPSWLSIIDNGNGQAMLGGTPTSAAGTTHPVQLRVRDAAGAEAYHACILTLLAPTDLPVLASSPSGNNLGVGQELVLRASASGIGPFQWQWFKDGKAITGATGSTFVISEVGTGNAGRYHVSVSNVVGPVVSATVEVNVRPADRYAGDWPTFGGSPAHTGRHPAAIDGCQFMPAWSVEVQNGSALNRAAIAADRAVVVPQGSGDTPQLYSLSAATGQQLWATTFGAQWESYEAPAVGEAGIFINGGTYGGMYGFNTNGSQRFFQSLAQYDRWTPTLANDRLFSWVAGIFTEHNPNDGSALWSLNSDWSWNGWSMSTVSAVSGDSAALISTTELLCVDLPTRSIRWRVPSVHRGSPGIADGRVFAIQGNAVRSYALADGSPGLVYQTTSGTGSNDLLIDQPILFNARLVISSESRTWIFNLQNGVLLQTLTVGGRLSYSNGLLLAAGNDGVLRAFAALNTNPKLASLKLGSGAFLPQFDSLKTRYIATVPFDTGSVTITPTTQYPAATVKINGVAEANGTASRQLSLNVGENELQTLVTAEDGITTMTYTIAVTRLPRDFIFNSAADVPLTANGFSTGEFPINIILNYPPVPGTTLTMVNNTALDFIYGRFSNLAQGQRVWLAHNGGMYPFVANYHGGTGNDLVLQWAGTRVSSWGLNNYGQLGDGGNTQRLKPVAVDHTGVLADKTIFAVSTGSLHSVALCSDGTLSSWGYNVQGQLGDNRSTNKSVPVEVNTSGVLAGRTVVAISSGSFHNLALCSDGTVAAWGYNNHGQLGDGTRTTARVPVLVKTDGVLTGKQVVAVAAGAYQSFALCSDGTLAAWGYNDEGELGNGGVTGSTVPVAVNTGGVLAGRSVATIAAGQYHALALCTDGTLVSWGYNPRGQLGNSSTTDSKSPVAINSFGTLSGRVVTAIGTGTSHSLALCADGTLASWGYNSQSQLGVTGISQSTTPVSVPPAVGASGRTIHSLSVGAHHNLLRFTDGGMAAWGGNTNGQLGAGNTQASAAWVNVDTSALERGGFIMFAASGRASSHNLAVFAVTLDPPVGLEAWRYENFSAIGAASAVAGDCEDCDHDGIPNLVEYAFGLDPHQNSAGQIPRPERIGNRLEFRFSGTQLAPDIEYGAEWSPDLSPGSWRDIPDSGSDGDHLFSLPLDSAPNRFMRLRVRTRGNSPE
ncbi:MAG: hypothetical protein CFE26_01460 [Verrucomicrobiales bacterium VVV1]|nr:MAG: hypothetical protein CFE26_01460 [Verrucomicrobiales bacterium VVV1]